MGDELEAKGPYIEPSACERLVRIARDALADGRAVYGISGDEDFSP